MSINLAQKYHDLANAVFDPRMINDPDDFEALFGVCKRMMHENGMMCPDEPDSDDFRTHLPLTEEHPVMSFIYRAMALCELNDKGFVYARVGDQYVLETLANTTAACFNLDNAEPPVLSP